MQKKIWSKFHIFSHVDGAYAGNSFVCPENRKLMDGIELVSFLFY
jgi:glutamate/tyrosine decarboxylase-like PLP-dependent enzyme